MDLITDSNLCSVLGFDLSDSFGNVRRYAKTAIKYIQYSIQESLDDLSGESLETLSDITDKITDATNDLLSVIDLDPYTSAANTILNCIGVHLTSYNQSLGVLDWRKMLNDWLKGVLDSLLSDPEKLLWDYLDQLEALFSPYELDKIMALAYCLAGCPGVSGASTPGPDGWGVVTPQGWVYIDQDDFTDLINTIGLGTDAKIEFDMFGSSGSTYGSRIRTIQDSKNEAIGALTSVATNTVPPDEDSQQVITSYNTLVSDVEEAYAQYLGINEDILECMVFSNEEIKEVDIYIATVYKLAGYSYRTVADSGKTKMNSIYGSIQTYYTSAKSSDSAALTAYNELDLSTLQSLISTNNGYLASAITDKGRVTSVKNVVRSMARALEDKGTIEGSVSLGGSISRGREAIKPATGTGSYQSEIDAI